MHNTQERIHSRQADSQGTSTDLLLDRTTKIRTRGVILLFLRLNQRCNIISFITTGRAPKQSSKSIISLQFTQISLV